MSEPRCDRDVLLGHLRDAAAQHRLLVVTGAGISSGLRGANRPRLPNWGELVQELRMQAPRSVAPADDALLDRLMPQGLIDKVHGDALIEASEIIQNYYQKDDFTGTIARLCSEAPGETSDTHRAIADAAPAGIITFNYDQAHETALQGKRGYSPIVYSDDGPIKEILSARGGREPFLLKAHGCVSRPDSLVLTSSSYRAVLSGHRPYRLFLQHALVTHTVLIVGFALRDRDFDQLLSTLEVELGIPTSRHIFIHKPGEADDEGRLQTAALSALTRRFAVHALPVERYEDIPSLIRSIATTPGPVIDQLIAKAQSTDGSVRQAAHDQIELLGEVGRAQVRLALTHKLPREEDPALRRESIYTLGKVMDGGFVVADALMREVTRSVARFQQAETEPETDCVAHALLALRRTRTPSGDEPERLRRFLEDAGMKKALRGMDDFLRTEGGIPRLEAYAAAAVAEVAARAAA